ncbi:MULTISPECIES: quinone oxidoreductase [unclassified Beijerinckia]|uniref:quinone oxidoreductase family protein n=1 Tax=unclassified Beijerinckia TaxID=2638183 RepID=UPI00089B59EF|nr:MULTISPECIES: quinone oxidoreductase [unclassified Beijerinckia]MDH7799912.1 NADPH2:quinone reductase [Beijerinckia sp. GAS462]SED42199.1 NADPH2:quinone reductase [Beijerinckia sp. 28-YEA-48]
MTKAIRIHGHGGPEVMRFEEIELPPPGPGEVRVRHTAVALNFSDINVRRGGFYQKEPLPMPIILGNEAAAVVTELGPDVTEWRVGDRVGYVGMGASFFQNTGSYAQERNVFAARLAPIPDNISDVQAASLMLKGLTASNIINKIYRPKPDDTVLIHAAASGVGLILVQWCKHHGATVIGTVGSADKAEIAKAHGCDHTILYRQTDFVQAVKAIVPQGVTAVLDGVGKDTFVPSMDCTAPFGTLVNYGNASGHVPPIDILDLSLKGTLNLWRPGVHYFLGDPVRFRALMADLFELVGLGVLKTVATRTYPLQDAAIAHRDAESAAHAGPVVLLP